MLLLYCYIAKLNLDLKCLLVIMMNYKLRLIQTEISLCSDRGKVFV